MKDHRDLSAKEIQQLLTSLVKGKSSTEKCMVGILLDAITKEQRKFDPACFEQWLDYLVGWAEVDSSARATIRLPRSLPTGKFGKFYLPVFQKAKTSTNEGLLWYCFAHH
jgi:hypothetical protein